jgi:serine/threonine protein kinase
MNDLNQTVDEPAREPPAADSPAPTHIGRYRIEKVLGQGGFGLVYLAHDDQLQRLVAIKVPHPQRVAQPEDAEAYLTEARTVANLEHPQIVPVYDVGSTPDFPCFVVSRARRRRDCFPSAWERAALTGLVENEQVRTCNPSPV